MQKLLFIDLLVLVGYLFAVVLAGSLLATRSADDFMAGGRSMPGWAIGLSMFGSYISSISYLANPGKAFASNWSFFVFSLATPVAAIVAAFVFVPFFRRTGEVSAYEHLEKRFGPWARTYAVVCFLLTQMTRNGTIIYLLALVVSPLTGMSDALTIIVIGALMTLYTTLGGMKAVVWVGAAQSVVLLAGPVICIVVLLRLIPGGAGEVVAAGVQHQKFSLGSFDASLIQPTFWVLLIYGLFIHLGNFGVDQGYVQRYITAKSDRAAKQSVWLTALLYVPTAAAFFWIGTALWTLHARQPELFPAEIAGQPDKVFPFFITHFLPAGLSGLVVASIVAASMDTSLNAMATLTLCDLYKRYWRPKAGERESLAVLHGSTAFWGAAAIAIALAMRQFKNVLDVWWVWAGILSGGMLGLFLLGLLARRAKSLHAGIAVAAGVLVIVWMTLSPTNYWPASLGSIRNPMHGFLVIVVGTLVILLVGIALSPLGRRRIREIPK